MKFDLNLTFDFFLFYIPKEETQSQLNVFVFVTCPVRSEQLSTPLCASLPASEVSLR
jgi:hypothetical protein